MIKISEYTRTGEKMDHIPMLKITLQSDAGNVDSDNQHGQTTTVADEITL